VDEFEVGGFSENDMRAVIGQLEMEKQGSLSNERWQNEHAQTLLASGQNDEETLRRARAFIEGAARARARVDQIDAEIRRLGGPV